MLSENVLMQVKMNRMRQRIAQRLKDAQNTNAMLTTFSEIDMRYNDHIQKYKPRCLYEEFPITSIKYFPQLLTLS